MSQIIDGYKADYEKTVEHLKNDISSIKTGRATPLLVEDILVDSYGSKMPLKQLASITVPDPRSILIEPWDKTVIKEMEKAIANSNRGLNPVNEGAHLRIVISSLTEEDRKQLVKLLNQKLEQARISVRGVRDKIREIIFKMEKDKEISEDDKFRFQKEIDEMTGVYNEKIKEAGERKETEINTI